MKKYLNSVEEVVKALKEGKEIFNIDDSSKYFMIGDTICKKYENNTIVFNASGLSSGVYFYRIISKSAGKDFIITKKMTLLK